MTVWRWWIRKAAAYQLIDEPDDYPLLAYTERNGRQSWCIRESEVDNVLEWAHDCHGHYAADIDGETTDWPLLLAYLGQGYSCLLPELPKLPVDRSETTVPSSETDRSVATDGHDRDRWPWSHFSGIESRRAPIYPHCGGLFYEVCLGASVAGRHRPCGEYSQNLRITEKRLYRQCDLFRQQSVSRFLGFTRSTTVSGP